MNDASNNSTASPPSGAARTAHASAAQASDTTADIVPLGNEEQLRLATRASGVGLFEINWQMRRRYWSPELRDLLRVPEEVDVTTDSHFLDRMVPAAQRARMREKLKQSLEPDGDGEYQDEHEVLRYDGVPAWILLRGKTFFADKEGTRVPVRTIGLVVDITERKRAERTNALLASVVGASGDAILSADAAHIIQTWNEGAERLYGFSANEAIGQPLTIIAPGHLRDELEILSARTLEGERVYCETERCHKSGRLIPVGISASPIRGEQGRIVGLSAVHRDMTQHKRYEEHLAFTSRELSHRTKNMLAVVQALARQILRQSSTLPNFEARFSGCVQALACCHDLLVQHDWKGADLGELVRLQLAPFAAPACANVSAQGPQMTLKPSAMQSLGLALHELATNAAKYGALSVPTGLVAVSWARAAESGGFSFTWREQGGPRVRRPRRSGFGTEVLRRTGPALDGVATVDFRPEGFVWTVLIGPRQIVGAAPEPSAQGYQ